MDDLIATGAILGQVFAILFAFSCVSYGLQSAGYAVGLKEDPPVFPLTEIFNDDAPDVDYWYRD